MKNSITDWYRNVIRNPKYRWWIIIGSLVYLLSPIDISPDFIPVVGWIDDGLIATLLVAEVSQILLEQLKGRIKSSTSEAPGTETPSEATTVDVNAASVE